MSFHEILTTVEIEVKYLKMRLPVKYEEEEMPYDFPGRSRDMWECLIDVDRGVIIGWTATEDVDLHLTVKDEGHYQLLDPKREVLGEVCQDYVPHGVVPGKYGDVVCLEIDASGKVKNWPKSISVDQFFQN